MARMRHQPQASPSDEWSVIMYILKSLFEMGLSVLRAALRVVAEIALTPRRAGDSRGLTVSALRSCVAAKRAHRSQVWMPSARVLWCYAIILAAERVCPPPPRDAAEPAGSLLSKSCYSRGRKRFDRRKPVPMPAVVRKVGQKCRAP